MGSPKRFSPEVRERAVSIYASRCRAILSIVDETAAGPADRVWRNFTATGSSALH